MRPLHRSVCARGAIRTCVALVLVAGAACRATAQTPQPAGPGVDGLLEQLHIKGRVGAAPDFVTQSRSKDTSFIPVGTTHPERPVKVMTPAQVTAETDDLDAARIRQQKHAGQRPAAVPLKPAKADVTAKKTVR